VKRNVITAAMMLIAVVCAAPAADAPVAAADPALSGEWIVQSAEYRGEKNADPVGDKFTFAADKITVNHKQGKSDTAAYRVDAKANPKEIDLTPLDESGGDAAKAMLGIYEVEGQTLKICMNDRAGGLRPTKFNPGKWSNCVLLTLKRAK
jgi:uncharacterized protein (TIGR03067 family)